MMACSRGLERRLPAPTGLEQLAARLAGFALALLILVLAALPHEAGAEPVRILAFGDSLVHGYGLQAGETFPEQLQAALKQRGLSAEVINAGNSGDTSAAGRARLDWALADEPDLVLVEFGGNDSLRGIDPADTRRNLDDILARLTARGLPVLLAGMRAPRNMGDDYVEDFDSVFPQLAEKHGVTLYPFFLEGVALDPALNLPDGIHPNPKGVAVIVENILPAVEGMIRALEAGGGDG